MKIRIDRGGLLTVDSVEKYCPFVASTNNERLLGSAIRCGDWCPLFGVYYQVDRPEAWITDSIFELEICQGRSLIGELIDERPKA